jgi:SnoaL-like domain
VNIMKESDAVREALQTFYQRFSAHEPDGFADILATGEGVSVIGSAPGEGHTDRESWVSAYATSTAQTDVRLEGGMEPRAWQEGSVGFCVDQPRFVMADGSFLRTRLTGVLHQEGDDWKVVHLHFSVGVPDEAAMQPGPAEG